MAASGSTTTATVARVATSTTSATLLAAGGGQRSTIVVNESAGNLYLLLGTGTASASNYSLKMATNTATTVEGFDGAFQGVLDAGSGNAQITTW